MTKEQKKIFTDFCYSYAQRFLLCMSQYTTERYMAIFSKLRYWRVLDYMDFKYDIKISENDNTTYKEYENIMIKILSKRVEELKEKAKQKERTEREKKTTKRKK